MRARHQRAFALASVLLLAAVVLVVALTIAAIGNYQLMSATHQANERQALARADGLIREICAQLAQTPTYGVGLSGVLTFPTAAPPPDQCAQATFDPAQAQLPTSTNNTDGTHGVGYNNTAVPSGSVVIYAVGRANAVTERVQATVQVPKFPYAIASDGDTYLPGGTLLQGASSMQQYVTDSQTAGSLSANLPASVGVEGQLTLDGPVPSIVEGDVVYGGTLNVTGTASVKVGGAVRQSAIEVPQLSVPQLELQIPAGSEAGPGAGDVVLDDQHVYYVNGPYAINSLTLNNAELFVDGPLTVNAGVSGIGGVFVNGPITIGGNAVLNASNNVALVSEGDLTMNGAANYFQGLVYCHGGTIHASSITVVGAMLAAKSPLGTPKIFLSNNAQVVYVPDVLDINLQATPTNSEWTVSGLNPPILVVNWTVPPGSLLGGTLVSGGGTLLGPDYSGDLGQDAIPMDLSALNHPRPMTPAEFAANATLLARFNAAMALTPQGTAWQAMCNATYGNGNPDINWSFIPGWQASISITAVHYNALNNCFEMWDPPLIYYEDGSQKLISGAQFDAYARAQGLSQDACIDAMMTAQTTYMNIANSMLATAPPPNTPPVGPFPPHPMHLDLNRFLSTQNPVEITSWRSY